MILYISLSKRKIYNIKKLLIETLQIVFNETFIENNKYFEQI